MKTLTAAFFLSMALATACGSSTDAESNASQTLEANVADTFVWTALVPSGLSTTSLVNFTIPQEGTGLNVEVSGCFAGVTHVYTNTAGIGMAYLDFAGGTYWKTPSGSLRTFLGVQLYINNPGLPAYCTYTVKPAIVAIAF